jgi:hypothetical protein
VQSLLAAGGLPGQKAHLVAHAIATQRGGGGVASNPLIGHAAQVAFIDSLNEILLLGAIVAFAGALAGLLLVRTRDFAHGAEPAPAAA